MLILNPSNDNNNNFYNNNINNNNNNNKGMNLQATLHFTLNLPIL